MEWNNEPSHEIHNLMGLQVLMEMGYLFQGYKIFQLYTSHKHRNNFGCICGTLHIHCVASASDLFFDQVVKSKNIFILEAKACCALLLLKVVLYRYKNSRRSVCHRFIHRRSAS